MSQHPRWLRCAAACRAIRSVYASAIARPPPTIIREVKFGGQNGPRDERSLDDFRLKAQIIELFDELDRLGDGVIDVLTIKHGLPFNMHVNLAAGAR